MTTTEAIEHFEHQLRVLREVLSSSDMARRDIDATNAAIHALKANAGMRTVLEKVLAELRYTTYGALLGEIEAVLR